MTYQVKHEHGLKLSTNIIVFQACNLICKTLVQGNLSEETNNNDLEECMISHILWPLTFYSIIINYISRICMYGSIFKSEPYVYIFVFLHPLSVVRLFSFLNYIGTKNPVFSCGIKI